MAGALGQVGQVDLYPNGGCGVIGDVFAFAALQGVAAGSAVQRVVAGQAAQGVVAAQAAHQVVADGSRQDVVIVIAGDEGLNGRAGNALDVNENVSLALAADTADEPAFCVPDKGNRTGGTAVVGGVDAGAAVQGVGSVAAVQQVVARAGVQRVVAVETRQAIAVPGAPQRIVIVGAVNAGPPDRRRPGGAAINAAEGLDLERVVGVPAGQPAHDGVYSAGRLDELGNGVFDPPSPIVPSEIPEVIAEGRVVGILPDQRRRHGLALGPEAGDVEVYRSSGDASERIAHLDVAFQRRNAHVEGGHPQPLREAVDPAACHRPQLDRVGHPVGQAGHQVRSGGCVGAGGVLPRRQVGVGNPVPDFRVLGPVLVLGDGRDAGVVPAHRDAVGGGGGFHAGYSPGLAILRRVVVSVVADETQMARAEYDHVQRSVQECNGFIVGVVGLQLHMPSAIAVHGEVGLGLVAGNGELVLRRVISTRAAVAGSCRGAAPGGGAGRAGGDGRFPGGGRGRRRLFPVRPPAQGVERGVGHPVPGRVEGLGLELAVGIQDRSNAQAVRRVGRVHLRVGRVHRNDLAGEAGRAVAAPGGPLQGCGVVVGVVQGDRLAGFQRRRQLQRHHLPVHRHAAHRDGSGGAVRVDHPHRELAGSRRGFRLHRLVEGQRDGLRAGHGAQQRGMARPVGEEVAAH